MMNLLKLTCPSKFGLVAALLVAGNSFAAELPRVEFKGVPMGATQAELQERMPDIKCVERYSYCALSPSESSVYNRYCPSTTRECFDRFLAATGFGPAPVVSWNITLRDGRVVQARIEVLETKFDAIVTALVEKYGPAQSDKMEPIQNKLGATFDNRILAWALPTGTISIGQRYGTVDKSMIILSAPGYLESELTKERQKNKASAKNL